MWIVRTYGGRDARLRYCELNRSLRKRDVASRKELLRRWGGYCYYLMRALGRLPDVTGVFYRGYPDRRVVEDHYRLGSRIQWGAFSSTTRDASVAHEFTDRDKGVVFRLTLSHGKNIVAYAAPASETHQGRGDAAAATTRDRPLMDRGDAAATTRMVL